MPQLAPESLRFAAKYTPVSAGWRRPFFIWFNPITYPARILMTWGAMWATPWFFPDMEPEVKIIDFGYNSNNSVVDNGLSSPNPDLDPNAKKEEQPL